MGKYIKTAHEKLVEDNIAKGKANYLEGYSMIDAGTSFIANIFDKLICIGMFFYEIGINRVKIPKNWRE